MRATFLNWDDGEDWERGPFVSKYIGGPYASMPLWFTRFVVVCIG